MGSVHRLSVAIVLLAVAACREMERTQARLDELLVLQQALNEEYPPGTTLLQVSPDSTLVVLMTRPPAESLFKSVAEFAFHRYKGAAAVRRVAVARGISADLHALNTSGDSGFLVYDAEELRASE